MKKIFFALMITLSLFIFGGIKNVKADNTSSTSDFMPHRYILSGYDIPTSMTYDENSVIFNGSLNAGLATTGFNYLKPIDINDFTIEMEFDIPDIDKLTWLCLTFLDTNLMMDSENNVVPVSQPFNAMSGKNGYTNNEQTGLVLQLYTQDLIENNVLGFDYISKNLNFETGEKTTKGWKPYTSNSIVNAVKLDDQYQENFNFKLSVTADEDELLFNIQDGAWKYHGDTDEEGVYGSVRNSLTYANTQGLKTYFADKDCYFALVLMYKDEMMRDVTLKVNKVNGVKASDNLPPSYLSPKEITKDGIKAIIPANAIGVFGVYPNAIDGLKVTKFDEDDGDYETVARRATSLKGTLIDYFRVVPQIGTKNITLVSPMTVEYTVPSGYDQYKAYYINDDEETEAIPSNYVTLEGDKLSIKVDNEIITKVAIYGVNNQIDDNPTTTTITPGTSNPTGSTSKRGCKGVIGASLLSLFVLSSSIVISLKKKREE